MLLLSCSVVGCTGYRSTSNQFDTRAMQSTADQISDHDQRRHLAYLSAWDAGVDVWSVALWWGVQLALITFYCTLLLFPFTRSLTLSLLSVGIRTTVYAYNSESLSGTTLHRLRAGCCCNWLLLIFPPPPSSSRAMSVHSSRCCVAQVR